MSPAKGQRLLFGAALPMSQPAASAEPGKPATAHAQHSAPQTAAGVRPESAAAAVGSLVLLNAPGRMRRGAAEQSGRGRVPAAHTPFPAGFDPWGACLPGGLRGITPRVSSRCGSSPAAAAPTEARPVAAQPVTVQFRAAPGSRRLQYSSSDGLQALLDCCHDGGWHSGSRAAGADAVAATPRSPFGLEYGGPPFPAPQVLQRRDLFGNKRP